MKKAKVLISWSGDNYAATCDEVDGVVIATGKTESDAKKAFVEAFKFHTKEKYELVYELHTSAILHNLDGIITRAALSRVTGINEKQLGHYLSGYRNPRPEQRRKIIAGIHTIGNQLTSVV